MSRREAALSALLIFALALTVRAFFAAQIVFPKPEDTAYYVGVAQNLLEGRGLVSDAMWSYGTPPLVFPRPAFEVWMPLPTWLAAIPMALLGSSFASAQVSSVLIGAIVPVIAWRIAADVAQERGLPTERARTLALGAGLACVVYLPLLLHSALPDSTMPFAALALLCCWLMARIARDPRGGVVTDPRLVSLGLALGLAALTRNEAAWLAVVWVYIAWRVPHTTGAGRLRLIGVVGIIAVATFAPWAIRNWYTFGSPLPGQAITNAFSVTGHDIFAWNDPPTLSRYLAVGAGRLIEMRIEGLWHNLGSVLLLPGFPVSLIGLAGLAWQARGRSLRPLLLVCLITFLVTSLVFPVATTWGTFLHAAGPVHVLLVICALLVLDAGLARLGSRLSWTRPVAWLGVMLAMFSSALFSVVLLPTFGGGSRATAAMYEELNTRMAASGRPIDEAMGPLISNFPIWVAETQGTSTLALPDEPADDVLDLARSFGARILVLTSPEGRHWPAELAPDAARHECFERLDLGTWTGPGDDPLLGTSVYEIVCP